MRKIIVKSDEEWFPPFLDQYTKRDEHWIDKLYFLFYPNEYISDPMGYDQCLCFQYDMIPWLFRKLFFKCKTITIDKETYERQYIKL